MFTKYYFICILAMHFTYLSPFFFLNSLPLKTCESFGKNKKFWKMNIIDELHINYSNDRCVFPRLPVSVALRTHHRRGHPAPGQLCVQHRAALGAGARQLPPHHRRLPGPPPRLPQPPQNRTLRLPAHHQGRHSQIKGQFR